VTGPSFAIVCTTIGDGSFLKHYAAAITEADAQDRVTMIVIPDRKTPAGLYAAVIEAREAGITVLCPDLNEQEQFLVSLGAPAGMFPWDTDHRRNVGYLMAWRDGADIMVSVDDDNLPQEDWLADHEIVTAASVKQHVVSDQLMSGSSGFWNPCDLLDGTPYRFWPRGYPYGQRKGAGTWYRVPHKCEVAINAGLWIGDPDVDAVTRLAMHPETVLLKDSTVLGPWTWAPVNSQNTAIRRDVIPAYYFFRSGRFGDIYQGYLAQACAKAMGHAVRFGTPAADCSVRNDHDLLRDLQLELPDILITDAWLDWLTSQKPEGSTYADAYGWLSHQLRDHAEFGSVGAPAKQTFHSMASQMQQWLALIRKIGA
jgi:hypothetical protein